MKKSQSANILERMQLLEQAMTKDNFVRDIECTAKDDPDYGKPQQGEIIQMMLEALGRFEFCLGTRTAKRGEKAHKHVHKEILDLCEVIYLNGFEQDDHTAMMFFGDLFR